MIRGILRRAGLGAAVVVVLATTLSSPAFADGGRTFSCTGSAGELFTERTVTGLLTQMGVPRGVQVIETGAGRVVSARAGYAAPIGDSWLHAGFVAWNITGASTGGDKYTLHMPLVLPGRGGFFDADLEIAFAGGANGELQIPMLDCTVTGGPASLMYPAGTRSFSCTGGQGEAFTFRTVTGALTSRNVPRQVAVTETFGGLVDSRRLRESLALGSSWLHGGYTAWDVTGPNTHGDLYSLHLPPVLPAAGGFFDADLEVAFDGGANGELQIPMFDCTVR